MAQEIKSWLSSATCECQQEDDSRSLKFLMSLDVSVSKEIISSFDEMPPSARDREMERATEGLEEDGKKECLHRRKTKAISRKQDQGRCVGEKKLRWGKKCMKRRDGGAGEAGGRVWGSSWFDNGIIRRWLPTDLPKTVPIPLLNTHHHAVIKLE